MANTIIGFPGMSRNIHSGLTNILNNLGHFTSGIPLFGRHIAQIIHHIFNGVNILHHFRHSIGRFSSHSFYRLESVTALPHTLGYASGGASNFINNGFNFLGGFLAFCSQLANLLGYYSKALAMLSGSCSLNGSIQSQQIGLAGNTANFLYKICNLLRSIIQFINIIYSCLYYLSHILNSQGNFIYITLIFFYQRSRGMTLSHAGLGSFRNITGYTGNFHNTSGCLFQTAGIVLRLGTNIVGQIPQLPKGNLKLVNTPYNLLGCKGHFLRQAQQIHIRMLHLGRLWCHWHWSLLDSRLQNRLHGWNILFLRHNFTNAYSPQYSCYHYSQQGAAKYSHTGSCQSTSNTANGCT